MSLYFLSIKSIEININTKKYCNLIQTSLNTQHILKIKEL